MQALTCRCPGLQRVPCAPRLKAPSRCLVVKCSTRSSQGPYSRRNLYLAGGAALLAVLLDHPAGADEVNLKAATEIWLVSFLEFRALNCL